MLQTGDSFPSKGDTPVSRFTAADYQWLQALGKPAIEPSVKRIKFNTLQVYRAEYICFHSDVNEKGKSMKGYEKPIFNHTGCGH